MRFLLDADILRYQIGSIQQSHPFIEGEYISASVEKIHELLEDLIQHAIKVTSADEYVCVFSGKGNFRNEIAKQQKYKGNRDPSVTRPYHYDTVFNYISSNHPVVVVDGIEADDWLGIEQRKDPENTIIGTRDKDLLTVFGNHYRWACGDKQPEVPPHWVTPYEAAEFFFHQMLTGDSTDNIVGCGQKLLVKWGGKMMLRRKGVGETGADKILEPLTTVLEMYNAVKREYESIFGDTHEEVMLENARLLYIGQLADNLFDWSWLNYELKKDTNNDFVLPTEQCEQLQGFDNNDQLGLDCESGRD